MDVQHGFLLGFRCQSDLVVDFYLIYRCEDSSCHPTLSSGFRGLDDDASPAGDWQQLSRPSLHRLITGPSAGQAERLLRMGTTRFAEALNFIGVDNTPPPFLKILQDGKGMEDWVCTLLKLDLQIGIWDGLDLAWTVLELSWKTIGRNSNFWAWRWRQHCVT